MKNGQNMTLRQILTKGRKGRGSTDRSDGGGGSVNIKKCCEVWQLQYLLLNIVNGKGEKMTEFWLTTKSLVNL